MEYAAIIVLLMMSAFFSAAETAFSSVNRIRLKHSADEGNKKAARTLKIAEHFDRTITTILIGNNIVNILSSSIGTVVFTKHFGDAGVGISTAVMTVLVLIFGEILPKTYAKVNAERLSLTIAGMLGFIIKIFTPLSSLFMLLQNTVTRISKGSDSPSVTEDELKYIINEIEEEGVLEEQESDLVKSALEFDEKTVEQILVPRVKVCAVEKDADIEEVRQKFLSEGYSRMPVCDHGLDNIVGIINEKDFFRLISSDDPPGNIHGILQKAIHFTEFMPISEALREMQRQKSHIAVINDQYGGTGGIITMEDIIEELVGEIYDESDEIDRSITDLGDGCFEVAAWVTLRDLADRMDIPQNLIDSDSNTAGGWALELFGRIPETGEETSQGIFTVKIISADESHVERLMIKADKPKEMKEE